MLGNTVKEKLLIYYKKQIYDKEKEKSNKRKTIRTYKKRIQLIEQSQDLPYPIEARFITEAFNLNNQSLSFLWQELRDQADYDFRWTTDTANRKVQAMMAAASAEGDAAKNWGANFSSASTKINGMFSTNYDI